MKIQDLLKKEVMLLDLQAITKEIAFVFMVPVFSAYVASYSIAENQVLH